MSRFSLFALYAGERFSLRVYLPLSLFLASAVTAIEPEGKTWWSFVGVALLFLLLLFPLRMLDDLSSIEEDRPKHPERLLCRTEDLRSFRNGLHILVPAVSCLLALFSGLWKGIGYALLFCALRLWYVLAPGVPSRLARGLLPLVKYPILILLVSSGPLRMERTWIPLALVLAAFLLYEVLHDPGYEMDHAWLGRPAVRRGRPFRFLPFAGAMAWFGVEIALR